MISMLVTVLFAAAFGFSIWAIAATIQPQFQRILFLLRHGPILDAPLPQGQRVTLRGRSAPVRVTTPSRHRAAA